MLKRIYGKSLSKAAHQMLPRLDQAGSPTLLNGRQENAIMLHNLERRAAVAMSLQDLDRSSNWVRTTFAILNQN